VTGIRLSDPALHLTVHGNLVRNCGRGLVTGRVASRVTKVIDDRTFMEASLPLEWRYSHQYQRWNVVWTNGNEVTGTSVIEAYDPTTLRFKLTAPREIRVGDTFEVGAPGPANWNIHDNTITGCLSPVVLDNYGSATSQFSRNLVSRGDAVGVGQAVAIRGRYNLIGNCITGFDEPGSAALHLGPDRLGQPLLNLYQGNLISHCAAGVAESAPGLWQAAAREGNVFTDCGDEPR